MARLVLVTGAAGNLARAVAETFVQQGDKVALLGRKREGLAKVYGGEDAQRVFVVADLLQPDALQAAVGKLGPIDVLCNLAGGFAMGDPVHATAAGDWQKMQDLNVRTLLNAVQAVVPGMVARGRGKVVNVGANSALRGAGKMGAYIAAKSEVLRITESMAAELREHGINVNCVLPSIIDTPENRAAMPDADPARWVAPAQLAQVIAFLASDAAAAIHGASVPVVGLS
ncbi:SDR family NAD(P)-dependent oxidoreductase [Ramlibacter sp. XY19]|uniref:SDR family NAD(P)-dependent oxidoreductase n=1 Tax=Ramlibacter paludis TaxID=2908000 RepID=UPI0023DA1ECA|nr:SDR family NAD(P)-dependent oxidoreductase [Ramlibacter paludis]MCG2592185.1 SDR family NAD(P)-dependent oxidoreductase [Ramlibacter paludis]